MKNLKYLTIIIALTIFNFSVNAKDIFTNVKYQGNVWCEGGNNPKCSIPKQSGKDGIQVAVVCFAKGERVSGMNKICYYDCLGSEAAITIKSYQLCPLQINR